jgi:uncharacterized protein YjbI with pentapeptide repeats
VKSDTPLPRPPRLPTQLVALASGSLSDELTLSDTLLTGDFSGQSAEDLELERSRIATTQFTGATLKRLQLTDVIVENADLSGADLDGSAFNRVEFRDCRMSGAAFTRCSFRDVLITGCRLDDANLRMSETKAVVFDGVDLRAGDFYGAKLDGTRFFDCNLTGAQFSQASTPGARFHGSTMLDVKGGQYLAGSVIDSTQVLPLALGVLSALSIEVDDDREPPVATGRKGHRSPLH